MLLFVCYDDFSEAVLWSLSCVSVTKVDWSKSGMLFFRQIPTDDLGAATNSLWCDQLHVPTFWLLSLHCKFCLAIRLDCSLYTLFCLAICLDCYLYTVSFVVLSTLTAISTLWVLSCYPPWLLSLHCEFCLAIRLDYYLCTLFCPAIRLDYYLYTLFCPAIRLDYYLYTVLSCYLLWLLSLCCVRARTHTRAHPCTCILAHTHITEWCLLVFLQIHKHVEGGILWNILLVFASCFELVLTGLHAR